MEKLLWVVGGIIVLQQILKKVDSLEHRIASIEGATADGMAILNENMISTAGAIADLSSDQNDLWKDHYITSLDMYKHLEGHREPPFVERQVDLVSLETSLKKHCGIKTRRHPGL